MGRMFHRSSLAANSEPERAPDRTGEAGFDAEALEGLCSELQAEIDAGFIPGVVLRVQRQGRPLLVRALGWSDAEARRAMRPDDLFRIFSMTKPLASVAALMLVEDGCLRLADPVQSCLPAFGHLPVTVQDLLLHTSGLTYGPRSGDPTVRAAYARHGIGVIPRALQGADLVRGLAEVPLVHPPGRRWEYGSSTDLLGQVVEAVSGARLGEFLRARLFEPLGMLETAFDVSASQAERVAQPFLRDPLGEDDPRHPDRWFDPTVPARLDSAGAGAISTAADYARFAQWLLDRRQGRGLPLLRPETVWAMTSDQLAPRGIPLQGPGENALQSPGFGFGYGLAVRLGGSAGEGATLPGSPGTCLWSGTAGTFFWLDPQHEVVGVYMSQAPGARRVADRRRVISRVHEALVGAER